MRWKHRGVKRLRGVARRTGVQLMPVFAVALVSVAAGCSNYRGAYALLQHLQVDGDLAVGGLLDRRAGTTNGALSAHGTTMLAQRAGAPDESARLAAAEIDLLLSGPAELALNAGQLAALRQRVGHRYVLVGEEGREPVTHVLFWDVLIVVPSPWFAVAWNIPVAVSRKDGVPHATRVLRVIDLASATVVAESYELLRDAPDEGEFSDGEVNAGLTAMGLR